VLYAQTVGYPAKGWLGCGITNDVSEETRMPLFRLPFHLESIEEDVIIAFSVGIVFIVFTLLADRGVRPFRLIVDLFLAIRMGAIEETKRFGLFKKAMYSMAAVFVVVGVFYGLVLVGVIQNGAPPPVPTIDDFIKMKQGAGR
jgi:hypothetical protein